MMNRRDSDDEVQLHNPERTGRRLVFDPTINAGHILTFVAALTAGFFAYTDVKQTNAVQDEQIVQVRSDMKSQQTVMRESLTDLKQSMRDVSRIVDDVRVEQLRATRK